MAGARDIGQAEPDDARAPAARPSPLAADGFRDDAHAVVIGIDRYADARIPDLRYARADAESVYQVLTDPAVGRFRPANVTLLLDEAATERRIRTAIGTTLPKTAAPDHTVVVYYAGHGAPEVSRGARAADGMDKYLVPHDAEAGNLRASAIPMEAVQQFFGWIDARQVFFFLDSCYSGGAGGRSFDPPDLGIRAALSDEFLEGLSADGRLVVTACAPNEVSLETPDKGHGLFTYYLVRGLEGAADADRDGLVTFDELYEYVYANVDRDARRAGGRMQPMRKGTARGLVYLTQYVSEEGRRARELSARAAAALRRDDAESAVRDWEAALKLAPDDAEARTGLASAYARAAARQQAREAERQRRREALEQRELALLAHRRSGALTAAQYQQALDNLEKDDDALTDDDRAVRGFVDDLLDGSISATNYVRSIALLARTPSGQTPAAPRPEPTAPPPASLHEPPQRNARPRTPDPLPPQPPPRARPQPADAVAPLGVATRIVRLPPQQPPATNARPPGAFKRALVAVGVSYLLTMLVGIVCTAVDGYTDNELLLGVWVLAGATLYYQLGARARRAAGGRP